MDAGGDILHSANDGATWKTQTSGTANRLNGVWGSSSSDVFAVGLSGTILHSTNDGQPGRPRPPGR